MTKQLSDVGRLARCFGDVCFVKGINKADNTYILRSLLTNKEYEANDVLFTTSNKPAKCACCRTDLPAPISNVYCNFCRGE